MNIMQTRPQWPHTVDDIVNKLCGQVKIASDLKDGEYDNLFLVKIRGRKISFDRRKYGYPSNPDR